MQLTDTGRIFFERCERIAQERDEAIALIGEQGEPQGDLRVTCSTAMDERFVAPIIRRFTMPHPKLNITIDLSNRIVDLVAEGYDLAVRTGHVADPRLGARRVASRTLFTCAAPGYLARMPKPEKVSDLAKHECIVGTNTVWHFKRGDKAFHHNPKGRFRCNSGHAVIEACIADFGICQLPDFYILPHLKQGMVELVLEDQQPEDEAIWAVYPQRRHLLPKIRQVVECLATDLAASMS
ncbi:DNA-binding transcriptional regulator, LysR family [Sphingobium sp. AP50]|uniref:LysR substrate-binding domain-containing protein n=1 Tax=Sphingobium sp. AP50 TaxID=1884369 RepID=UPI0008BE4347|nr:LysR substrate-binding domain-containing protein [Sphingobium sp. AP50]SEJ47047.1 DNA-binding transcriptional regulator, LysR family [Sphingobium sp. AP50]